MAHILYGHETTNAMMEKYSDCDKIEDEDIIKVTRQKGGYNAQWGNSNGTGKTHVEALKALHYMMNFFNGTIENPQPLPVSKEDIEFDDSCDNEKCPCEKNQEDPGPWTDRPEYDKDGMPSE